MIPEVPGSVERWTTKRRLAVVLSIVKGETSLVAAARKHGLTVAEVENWRDRSFLGAENALRSRPKDDEAVREDAIKKLKQKVGELVLDNDIFEGGPQGAPVRREDVRRVRAAVPQASERRVCRLLGVTRGAMRPTRALTPTARKEDAEPRWCTYSVPRSPLARRAASARNSS